MNDNEYLVPPVHPGEILLEEHLKPAVIGQNEWQGRCAYLPTASMKL